MSYGSPVRCDTIEDVPQKHSEHGSNFGHWFSQQPAGHTGGVDPKSVPPVLSTGNVCVAYQPIVDMRTGGIFAYEALVRSTSPEFTNPPALIEASVSARICGALGRMIREEAIRNCPDYPLFMNIHPAELEDAWIVRPDDPIFKHGHATYIEVTESAPLSHFELCSIVLSELRGRGVLVAVDDLGAGYSNMKYIADLEPNIVKLDMGLIMNLSQSPRRQRLVRALARLCTDLGARCVAEGIESEDDAQAVRDAGIHYGQGYFYARPKFAPDAFAKGSN